MTHATPFLALQLHPEFFLGILLARKVAGQVTTP
jgi:hypothetical protein